MTYIVYEHNLTFLSMLGILFFHYISQEVDDAIQYLADLDRVYSEHVRPRCGKIKTKFYLFSC